MAFKLSSTQIVFSFIPESYKRSLILVICFFVFGNKKESLIPNDYCFFFNFSSRMSLTNAQTDKGLFPMLPSISIIKIELLTILQFPILRGADIGKFLLIDQSIVGNDPNAPLLSIHPTFEEAKFQQLAITNVAI